MSNLRAIDEYRSTRSLPECYPWVRELLAAIESEVDERFVELPVDADGEPLHLNDEVVSLDTGARLVVTGVSDGAVQVSDFCVWERGDHFRHVKPRTVEDVLREFAIACEDAGNAGPDVAREIAKFAAELRMAGDAE